MWKLLRAHDEPSDSTWRPALATHATPTLCRRVLSFPPRSQRLMGRSDVCLRHVDLRGGLMIPADRIKLI
jgi:hypothetical protein